MTRLWVILILALLTPEGARAACTTVSGTALAFGSYTGIGIAQSTAMVTLAGCTTGFAYSVGLNAGAGTGGTVATRKMTSGALTLNYQMFQNAAHTTNWGNTLNVDAETGTTTAATKALTVYAELPAAQYPTPGTYTDTITATALNGGSIKGTFTVTATVVATCTISATNLAFGQYTPSAAVYATSTVTITCTKTTPYQVGIGYGLVNQPQQRYMRNAGGTNLQYLLYQDSAHTVVWGVPFYGTGAAGTGSGVAQPLTVYGEIYAGQFGPAGPYSDTLTVTVTY
jgi:spore coat protein U-like protein